MNVYDIPVAASAFDFGLSSDQIKGLIQAGADAVAEGEERRREGLEQLPSDAGDDARAEANTVTLYRTHLERVARSRAATILFSYAREDRAWVEQLRELLRGRVADPEVSVWDDSYIKPAALWRPAIEDAIRRARVAVLFVSGDFGRSRFIADVERPLIREHVPIGRRFCVSVDGTLPSGAEAAIQVVANAKALEGNETDAGRVLAELAHLVEGAYRGTAEPGGDV